MKRIFVLDPCWLCDGCLAADVGAHRRKPIGRFYEPNQIPFKLRACEQCEAVENCQFYPESLRLNANSVCEVPQP